MHTLYYFYGFNFILLLSGLLTIRLSDGDRKFSLSLVRVLFGLPLLAGEYFYLAYYLKQTVIPALKEKVSPFFQPQIIPYLQPETVSNFEKEAIPLLLLAEMVFALIWLVTAHWLFHAVKSRSSKPIAIYLLEAVFSLSVLAIPVYWYYHFPTVFWIKERLVFPQYGIFFFTNVFLLVSVLVMAWRLEFFWRSLSTVQRWEYKYMVIGAYLACGALGWIASYRFVYHQLNYEHLFLVSAFLFFAWILIGYATARHRLLNRKFFISRKVVYSFVAPLVFGLYLVIMGVAVFFMRLFGLVLPTILFWLLLIGGLVGVTIFAFSDKIRQKVKFFISTNFYNNKYEYRDEWLDFSRLLHGVLTETEIVSALYRILAKSLYTHIVFIWLGDEKEGYRIVFPKDINPDEIKKFHLSPDNSLINHLKTHDHYYLTGGKFTHLDEMPIQAEDLLHTELNLVLFSPLSIGERIVGIVGIGPEFTGGRFGKDDFDLLTALGTQAASALLAASMAEELAEARQQQAWDIMSAFILHDVKNAASMLSLIRQNASAHMHDPEFQEDILATIDDALKRMGKVQDRLTALKGEIIPVLQDVDLAHFLKDTCRKLANRLYGLKIDFDFTPSIHVKTDPNLLESILENLCMNALEAGGEGTCVKLQSYNKGSGFVVIVIADNGPGIAETLLPKGIFEPFKTTKPRGTGIGLWQVKRLITNLGGFIEAENKIDGGARFFFTLPVDTMADKKNLN
jgi:putative PEP-CTERM system histidine kinase